MKRAVAALFVISATVVFPRLGVSEEFSFPEPSIILEKASELSPPLPAQAVPVAVLSYPTPVEAESGLFDSEPDWSITPGVLCTTRDKDFEEFRYPERIPYCRRRLSTGEKKIVSEWYGVDWEDHGNYQYDHLLSLCLGGSNDLRNIWPMPWTEAREKAKLEFQLCERLRKGEVTQRNAVREELGWFSENAPDLLPRVLKLLNL